MLKIIKPKGSAKVSEKNDESQKIFVDRETQRNVFKEYLGGISHEGSLLIYYSGAGGIGKTALLNKLQNYLYTKKQVFKSVYYNFTTSVDMLETLKELKETLIKDHAVQFPLFEKGCILYYQKRGDMVSTSQIKETLNKSSILHKKVTEMVGTLDNANSTAKVVDTFSDDGIDFLDELADATAIGKVARLGLNTFNKFITKRAQAAKVKNDETYKEIVQELNARNDAQSAEPLKEYLPTLFARDISDWLAENSTFKLVIFMDTYENLTGDEKDIKQHEQLVSINREVPVDWWIETLLYETSGVLWVIAGRSENKLIGEEIEIIKDEGLFPLTALENNFADEFLQKSGVESPDLREGITKLTGGYPNYLSLCVDMYNKILEEGKIPTVEDFGEKREKVIQRLLNFMNETARNMVKRLCILGTWTDIFAKRVLSNLHETNNDAYNRIKNLSFVTVQSENIFSFDKTIQKILFDHLKENEQDFIYETRTAAIEFFNSAFYEVDAERNKNITDADREIFFRFWYEIILRTTDGAEYLMKLFIEHFEPLTSKFDDTVFENAIKQFQNKIKETDGEENIPFAYFEFLLATIKIYQYKMKDALELAESAYRKFESLPLTDEQKIIKISVISTLADVYSKLERTAAEIEKREQAVIESEKIFSDKTDENIISAKCKLASAFEDGEKKNRALEIYEEIYHTLEPLNNQKTMDAAEKYSYALCDVGRYNDALPLREKIVEFYRKTDETENLISALHSLRKISGLTSVHPKKLLSLDKEIVKLEKKNGDNVLDTLQDIYHILICLNCADEATIKLENFADKLKFSLETTENLDEELEILGKLLCIAKLLGDEDKAEMWKSQQLNIIREIVKIETCKPVEDYETAIEAIKNLQNQLDSDDYQEKIQLQRKIVELTEKNPIADTDDVIEAKKYLAKCLEERADNEIISAIKDSGFLLENKMVLEDKFEEYNTILEIRKEILSQLKKDNDDAKKILNAMTDIAGVYYSYLKNYSEALNWYKDILDFCRENFVEDAPEVITAMKNLAGVYEILEDFTNAENLRREILNINSEDHGNKSHSDVIFAKEILADDLHDAGKLEEELAIRKEVVELYRKNHQENPGNDSLYFYKRAAAHL